MMRPIWVGLAQGTICGVFSIGITEDSLRLMYVVCCAAAYFVLGHQYPGSKKSNG